MNKSLKGSVAILVTTMIYGSYGVFNRLIGNTFGVFSQNWVRNLIAIFLITIILVFNKQRLKIINKNDRLWVFVWMLTGAFVMLLLFQAFNHLAIATVYFLFYSTMIFSGVLCGKVFFREKINLIKIISIVLAFSGLFIIYAFYLKSGGLIYILMSLTAGLILGFWNSISKKFSDKYSNLQIVLLDAVASTVVALFGTVLLKEGLPIVSFNSGWLWITIYAAFQISSVGLLVYGFKNLEAQIASVVMPVEVIFASIFGYLVFKEALPVSTAIGGALIASAAFLPNVELFLKGRKVHN
jgi:S-adenosylmethionine uptake transporter